MFSLTLPLLHCCRRSRTSTSRREKWWRWCWNMPTKSSPTSSCSRCSSSGSRMASRNISPTTGAGSTFWSWMWVDVFFLLPRVFLLRHTKGCCRSKITCWEFRLNSKGAQCSFSCLWELRLGECHYIKESTWQFICALQELASSLTDGVLNTLSLIFETNSTLLKHTDGYNTHKTLVKLYKCFHTHQMSAPVISAM